MGIDVRALAITLLLAAALYFSYGIFVVEWIAVLPLALAFVIFQFPTPRWFLKSRDLVFLAVLLLFSGWSAASMLPEQTWLRSMILDVAHQEYLPAMRVLFGVAGLGCITLYFACRRGSHLAPWIFGAVLVAMLSAFALIVPTSPNAQIDVWTVHEEGAQAFIDGTNPYTFNYTNIFKEELRPYLTPGGVTYSYLPGVFIWMSPWKAIGLDTRYSQLLTRLLTCVLLVLIARKASGRRDFMTYVPALLFIMLPLNTFFIVRAWNDDISMMCYALAAYSMVSRKPWAMFIATNFLLLHKQHAIFFVPILFWFAWREWKDKWAWLKGGIVAGLVCGGYLIADWRNFLGSLYGLTFLKFPNIKTVFLPRRDPFSLMNYLQLFAGYKSSLVFLAVLAIMAFFILRANWKKPDAASVLRGLGAMCLTMFMFAPIAFANYYQFALGLVLIGFAATRSTTEPQRASWEPSTNAWILSYVAVRSFILFNLAWLIIETRGFAESANQIFDQGRWPYSGFPFEHLPFTLFPTLFAGFLSRHGEMNTEFLSFHTLFQLAMVICDLLIGWFVIRRASEGRTSKLALSFYIAGPLLLGPIWFTSPVLATAAAAWIGVAIYERISARSASHGFVRDALDTRREAVVTIASVSALAALFFVTDLAGFDVGLQPLLSPTHFLIFLIALLPIVPPLRPIRLRRFTVPAFATALTAALGLSAYFLWSFERVYGDPGAFSIELWIRNGLIAVALALLALSLKKGRPA